MDLVHELSKTKVLTIDKILYAPQSFIDTDLNNLVLVCNGCGAADSWFRPPSKIYGTQVVYAFHIHDWMYHEGRTIEDKDTADRVMLNNLYRLIELDSTKWYKPTFLQRRRALKYYWGVKYGGGPAYWKGK